MVATSTTRTAARTASRCGEKLDTATLTALLTTIEQDRSVATLRLCDANLTPSLVVQLADFLERNATLTHVDLSGNAINAHDTSCLAASLAKNRSVTHLSLARCSLQHEALASWVAFFTAASIERTSQLTKLNLAGNKLNNSIEQLDALLRAAQAPYMHVDLRKNQLSSFDIRRIAAAVATNDAIVKLQLDDNDHNNQQNDDSDDSDSDSATTNAHRRRGASTLKQRKQIAFCLRRNTVRLQRSATLACIQQIQHSALTVMLCHVDNVDLSIADAELLGCALRTTRSVTELRLASNALPPEGAKRIFCGLQTNTSVRRLDVLDNNIGNVGMRALAELLRRQADVADAAAASTFKTTKARSLSLSLSLSPRSPPLQSVHVRNSICLTLASGLLQPLARRTASQLYHAFAHYAALQRLTLANCALRDCDISVIVSGIAWRARVLELDLRNNALSDATAFVFVHLLHRSRRFARLDLSGNRFTLHGLLPLAQAASAHPSIRTLLFGRIHASAVRCSKSSDTAVIDAPAHEAVSGAVSKESVAALIVAVCAALQQSYSLAQVELRVATSDSGRDIAKHDVAALNAVLLDRSGAKRVQECDAFALETAVHAHCCRFRALVRQTAMQAVEQWCGDSALANRRRSSLNV